MTSATRVRVLGALFEHSPSAAGRSWRPRGSQGARHMAACTGLGDPATYCAPPRASLGVRMSRGGVARYTTLPYPMYIPKPTGRDEIRLDGRLYVAFSEEYLDLRGGSGVSKARRVLGFLRQHGDEAFFSTEVVDVLARYGVKPGDIMSNLRRYERRGLVYVRGYKGEERETPFREGFLLAWLDQDKPREMAIVDAVARTDAALAGRAPNSPAMERIHRFRVIIVEHSALRKLVGAKFVENTLGCTRHALDTAIERALQLYPDMMVLRLFDARAQKLQRYFFCFLTSEWRNGSCTKYVSF